MPQKPTNKQQYQEVELTGDFNKDKETISSIYKPQDMDEGTWRKLYGGIMGTESGGDVDVGRARFGRGRAEGVTGVMQVHPKTFKGLGFNPEDIEDPAMNFAAGLKNLRDDWEAFGRDKRVTNSEHRLALTIASYHAGRPRVEKDLTDGGDGVPDIDDGGTNTRDYTGNILDKILAGIKPQGSEAESEEPQLREVSAQDIADLEGGESAPQAQQAEQEVGVKPLSTEPIGKGLLSREIPEQKSFEEELVNKERRVRESLGVIVPSTHPTKFGQKAKVVFPYTPGEGMTADRMSDAITTALTGDQTLGEKFRAAVGNNVGEFADDITNEWFAKQLEAGNFRYLPADPNNPQAGGYIEGNVPVQNYVTRRIEALARGGVAEVQRETLLMNKERQEMERLVAEEEYGQSIAQWKDEEQKAIKRGDAAGRRQALENWTRLQAELDTKYPVSYLGEMWQGFKRGLGKGTYNVVRTGANIKAAAEAPLLSAEEIKRADERDRRVRKMENALESVTPQARSVLGSIVEGATSEVLYSPMYISGGMIMGPAGGIMTSALRDADKPIDEALQSIGSAVFELAGGSLLKSYLTAGKGLSARKELAAEMAIGGLTEAGGDATIDFLRGKEFDWRQAISNLVIGAGMEVGSGAKGALKGEKGEESEGEVPFGTAEARPFADTEVMSPIVITMGEDGKPRFGAIIRQGENVGFTEIPNQHPIIQKHALAVENGQASFIGVDKDQFDEALKDFEGTGGVVLPKLTPEKFQEYMAQERPLKGREVNDSEIRQRLSGEERGREESVEAGDELGEGEEAARAGRVLQARRKGKSSEERVAEARARFEAEPPTIRPRQDDADYIAEIEEEEGLPLDEDTRARVLEARARFEAQPPVIRKQGDVEPEQPADIGVKNEAARRARKAGERFEAEPPTIVTRVNDEEVVAKQGEVQRKTEPVKVEKPRTERKAAPITPQQEAAQEVTSNARQEAQPNVQQRVENGRAEQEAQKVEAQKPGRKQKRAFKGSEYVLDEDLTKEFDDELLQYEAELKASRGNRSALAKIGRAFGVRRRTILETQRQRDAAQREAEAETEVQRRQRESEESLDEKERATLENVYKKLGVRTDTEIRDLLFQANRRYQKQLQGTEAGEKAREADEKRNSLTDEERKVLSKVIQANFTAPMKKPSKPGQTFDYSKAVQGMTEEEFNRDPQLVANYRNLSNFFDALKEGKVPQADLEMIGERLTEEDELTPDEALEKERKEKEDITKGTKVVKRGNLKITLPQRLAAQWDAADELYAKRVNAIQNNAVWNRQEKTEKIKQTSKERQDARKRILSEYDALEAQQFKRGYLKSNGTPLQIIEQKGNTVVVRLAGKDETTELLRDEIETQSERAITRQKEPKLPLSVRARMMLGTFNEKSPAVYAKDGILYVNTAMFNKIEDALGQSLGQGFTFDKNKVSKVTAKLRQKGLNNIADLMDKGNRVLINPNKTKAGIDLRHERTHLAAEGKDLSQEAVKRLFRDGGNIDNLLNETTTDLKKLKTSNPYDVIQEVLAYGLTGDFDRLGVKPDTLYNALLDVIEAYVRQFPNEDVNAIAANALVNYEEIRSEAERKIRDEVETSAEEVRAPSPVAEARKEAAGAAPVAGKSERAAERAETPVGERLETEAAISSAPAIEKEPEAVKKSKKAREKVKVEEAAQIPTSVLSGQDTVNKVQTAITLSVVKNILRRSRQKREGRVDRELSRQLRAMDVSNNLFYSGIATMSQEDLESEIIELGGNPKDFKGNKDLMSRWLTREVGKEALERTKPLEKPVENVEQKKAQFEEMLKLPSPEEAFKSAVRKLRTNREGAIKLMEVLEEAERQKKAGNLIYLDKEQVAEFNEAWDKFLDADLTDLEAKSVRREYNLNKTPLGKRVESEEKNDAEFSRTAARQAILKEKAERLAENPEEIDSMAELIGAEIPEGDDLNRARTLVSLASALEKLNATSVIDAQRIAQNFLEPIKLGASAKDIKKVQKASSILQRSELTADELWALRDVKPMDTSKYAAILFRTPEQRSAAAVKAASTRAANIAAKQEKNINAINLLKAAREEAAAMGVQLEQEAAQESELEVEEGAERMVELGKRVAQLDPTLSREEISEYLSWNAKNARKNSEDEFSKRLREQGIGRIGLKVYNQDGHKRDTALVNTNKEALPVDAELERAARQYARIAGVGEYNVGEYHNFDPEPYTKIADLMESLPHEPGNEDVIRTYKAFTQETVDQYLFFLSRGYSAEPWLQSGQPYANSAEMREDVRKNKHMYFFLGGEMPADHPLAQPSGIYIGDYELSYNDVFRIVHDFFGHSVSGAQFGARGELNATDSHSRLYSWEALPAMLGETIFQNAWVNYGKHIRRYDGTVPKKGDKDFIPPGERPYADQKAMNVTPEHVRLWLSTYQEPPIELLKRQQKAESKEETQERKDAQRYQTALRKPESEISKGDIEATVRQGKFAVLSGNIDNIDPGQSSAEGIKRTKALATEMRKMGYQVLETDGVYAPEGQEPTVEPSLFVMLRDKNDVANMLRLGAKYGQAQVLIGEHGQYRAPYTTNVEAGRVGEETFTEAEAVFGKEAEAQVGKSKVKTANGVITISTPDLFASTRKQGAEEKESVARLEKAYKRSFANKAKANSGQLLDWLKERNAQGKIKPMGNVEVAKFLESKTKSMYGSYPDPDKMDDDQYDAVRTRRAVSDAIALIRNFQSGKDEETSGQSWYASAIRKMLEKTGEAFPEIQNIPQLRTLYELVLAVSSSGMKVQNNYNAATAIWQRMLEEFQLGFAENTNQNIFPVFQPDKPENYNDKGKLKQYGRFDPQFEKLNNLSRGLVPISSVDAKKLIEEGKGNQLTRTKYFEQDTSATQYYVKDDDLQDKLNEFGRIGGVLNYLLETTDDPLHPYKATQVLGPKIGAFFLNIAGFSQLVTVDMWAARWFYRVNGGLLNETTRTGIQDVPKNSREGDLIRGVMQGVANEWNATHENKLTPADVQAILWYGEKDIWHNAGAKDSGQINFFDAAERRMTEQYDNFDSTRYDRERVVNDWVAEAPMKGKVMYTGTPEVTEESKDFFIREMGMSARLGLAATARKQQMNNNLRNFDANTWVYMAERAKGSTLDAIESNELYRLLGNGWRAQTKTEIEDALQGLVDFNNKLGAQGLGQFILSVRRAGLLSGVKTLARNNLGNFAYQLLDEGRRGISAPIDIINAAVFGKERTVQGVSPLGILYAGKKGFTEGFSNFYKVMRKGATTVGAGGFEYGYDPQVRPSKFIGGKVGAKFLNVTLGYPATFIFRLQSASDVLFRTYAYHRSLYELAKLEEKNGGVKLQQTLSNPTVAQSDEAMRVAEAMVFQNDNALNTSYQRWKGNRSEPVKFMLDYTLPFVKTGSNIFIASMDYLGLPIAGKVIHTGFKATKAIGAGEWVKFKTEMWDAIDDNETRATIANLTGKGLLGNVLIYIGWKLAAAGLLQGIEEEDEKKRQKRLAQGSGAGHIKVGDSWYDIRQLSPVGSILLMGASLYGAGDKEDATDVQKMDAYLKVFTSLVVNGIPQARTANEFVNQRATNVAQKMVALDSNIPAIVGEIAAQMDDVQRERKSEDKRSEGIAGFLWNAAVNPQGIMAKIPGLREKLPAKEDVLGRPIEQPGGFDPFAAKKDVSTPATREAAEVGLSLTLPKRKKREGVEEPLEDFKKRKTETTTLIGRAIDAAIANAEYPKDADKKDRKEVLQSVVNYSRQLVKKGEKVSDKELSEIVKSVIEGRREIEAIEKDKTLTPEEKKQEKAAVSRQTGFGIKSATDDEDK